MSECNPISFLFSRHDFWYYLNMSAYLIYAALCHDLVQELEECQVMWGLTISRASLVPKVECKMSSKHAGVICDSPRTKITKYWMTWMSFISVHINSMNFPGRMCPSNGNIKPSPWEKRPRSWRLNLWSYSRMIALHAGRQRMCTCVYSTWENMMVTSLQKDELIFAFGQTIF